MRLFVRARFAVLFAGLAIAACDARITDTQGAARVGISLPKSLIAGDDRIAAQGAGDRSNDDNVSSIRVRISVAGQSRNLVPRPDFDPELSCGEESEETACILTVTFEIPSGSEGATFVLEIEALNEDGVVMYRIGPANFQLGSDGRTQTVTEEAEYVGPGANANGVLISPRSVTVAVGSSQAITCVPTLAGVPIPSTELTPLRLRSANPGIADVGFTTARTIQVVGFQPGTTQIFCALDFGTRAEDMITVTVTPGAQQTGSIVVNVRNASGSTLAGIDVELRLGANNTSGPPSAAQVTPSSGSVTFNGVPAGTYTIQASGSGFTSTSQNVTVTPPAPSQVNITLNANSGGVTGVVRNSTNQAAISGATVEIRSGSGVTTGATVQPNVMTNAQGQYAFSGLQPGTYTLHVLASGFQSGQATVTVVAGSPQVRDISLSPSASTGAVSGNVVNARNDAPLVGVLIEIRAGSNVTTGPTVGTSTTDGAGTFSFPSLTVGTYTIRASASGFGEDIRVVTVVGNQTSTITVAMTATLQPLQVEIVLTWGATPADLDAHLRLPDQSTFIFHANPGSCPSGIPQPCLANDDRDGLGPETMFIGEQQAGTYTFFVHNYTADAANLPAGDNSLATSGASVVIRIGGVPGSQTFTVPNQPGKLWTVFSLSGTTVTPINTMEDANLVPDGAALRVGPLAPRKR